MKIFGKNPSGDALEKVEQSPNYRENSFQNLSLTPMMAPDASYAKAAWQFFNKSKNTVPPAPLPSVKTDLKSLYSLQPVIVWFGHSSYLIHINGKNILVDPVFCGYAAPFSFMTKSFAGSNVYTVDDMPSIDVLIITHDHYDHLDKKTVMALMPKTKLFCTALGVGSHLQYWGIAADKIIEFDWDDIQQVTSDIQITSTTSRHFSGRLFERGKTLWSAFIIQCEGYNIYAGSDSGYDSHFARIGEQFGPFDLAILEAGQYNEAWPYIHMMPEETVQASIDLQAKILLAVHWGKFSLATHAWDEPIKRVLAKAASANVKLATPLIGEPLILGSETTVSKWWENVQ